jgi:hypothetical protein
VGRHAAPGRARRTRPAATRQVGPVQAPSLPAPAARDRVGPYDIAQAPPASRVDLGSLRLPPAAGVQFRFPADRDGVAYAVVLVQGMSAMQLSAYAAPRSEPIWEQVRHDILATLRAEGATVDELAGEYGPELHARMPIASGVRHLRLVGVDGPRWLLRADFHGPAAEDPGSAPELTACLRGLVVNRGAEARPVREPLPLRLPAGLLAEQSPGSGPAAGSGV